MADIFLSYRGAHFLVEPFETNLKRQGYTVYSDEDFDYRLDTILAKLHEFDAVIVIWSDLSLGRELIKRVANCRWTRVWCRQSLMPHDPSLQLGLNHIHPDSLNRTCLRSGP